MIYHVSVEMAGCEGGIDYLAGKGFSPEIRMTDVDYLMGLSGTDIDRLKKYLDERALDVLTHGPFFGLDVASLDEKISEYSIRCLERGIEVSAALGSRCMVIHTGFLPQFSRDGRRHWFRNWNDRMPRVARKARECCVKLALENTWDDRPEILQHLRDMIPGAGVGFCLDTGHVNAFSRLSIGKWWGAIGNDVVALHLHDNDGISDDHLPPGRGTFDFETLVLFLRRCNEMPLLNLEVGHREASEGRRYLETLFGRA